LLIKNTLFTIFNTVWSLVTGLLISSVLVVRTLGPENYGWFSYAMSIVAIGTQISSLGIDSITIKYANRLKELANCYYRFAHTLKFLVGFIIAIIMILFAFSRADITYNERSVLFFLSFVPMASSWGTFRARLTTELLASENVKNNVIVSVVGTLCRIAIVVFQLHWSLFALCVLIDRLLFGILTEISNAKHHGWNTEQWEFAALPKKMFLSESWPLFIAGVFNVLYLRVDQLMLFQLTSPSVLADYSIAVKWTESWYFIPSALVASVMAKLFSSTEANKQLKDFSKIFNLVGLISIGFICFFQIFSRVIIIRLYGNAFIGAIIPLKVLAFSGIVATLGSVWSTYIIALGKQKILLTLVVISATGNILLNFLLIPQFGALGAAYATIFANVLPLIVFGLSDKVLFPATIIMIKAVTGVPGVIELKRLIDYYRSKKKANYPHGI